MAVCYRHPNRETGVSCSNCGRPICPDCMTSTNVGMRCPECARSKTRVHTVRSMESGLTVTIALIVINVLVFVGISTTPGSSLTGAGKGFIDLSVYEAALQNGEWYRLITSGFIHAGILHIGLNMYILWFLGNMLEPALGPWRFGALYFASLLAGSFGALLVSPNAATGGASGAIFGLMGAAFVMHRARAMESGIGMLILINLAVTFIGPFHVSIGGHVGGLIGGTAAGWLMDQASNRRRGLVLPLLACALVGGLAIVGVALIV